MVFNVVYANNALSILLTCVSIVFDHTFPEAISAIVEDIIDILDSALHICLS